MPRNEHLAWCKERALAELKGDEMKHLDEAWASMVTDLGSHPETANHPFIKVGYKLLLGRNISTRDQMTKFINDFA